MITTVMNITGMSCASCATRIEKAVTALEGVSTATVNLATQELVVTHDESSVSVEMIAGTVEKLGYAVTARNRLAS